MDLRNKYYLRNTASGLGFYMFTSSLILYLSSYTMTFAGIINGVSYDNFYFTALIDASASILSMFIIGLLYLKLSRTSAQSVVPVRKVNFSLLYKIVLAGLAMSLLSNFVTDILLNNLSLFGYENHLDMTYTTNTPLENVIYFLRVALLPALVEEFMFRGIILHKLRAFGDGFAVLLSSLMFGLIHGNLVQIPFAFIVGLALGFAVVKTGSIIPSIIIHFLVNGSSVIVTILEKSVDETTLNICYGLFLIIVFIGAILSAIGLGRIKGFFSLKSNPLFPIKPSVRAALTSTGMIFALIFVILEIILSLSI